MAGIEAIVVNGAVRRRVANRGRDRSPTPESTPKDEPSRRHFARVGLSRGRREKVSPADARCATAIDGEPAVIKARPDGGNQQRCRGKEKNHDGGQGAREQTTTALEPWIARHSNSSGYLSHGLMGVAHRVVTGPSAGTSALDHAVSGETQSRGGT